MFFHQVVSQISSLLQDTDTKKSAILIHEWQNDSRAVKCRQRRMKSVRYLQRGRETWRSAAVVLPPGVTAERRLRTFKVDVLVHTGRIVVRHPVTTRSVSDQQQHNFQKSSLCVSLTQKKSAKMSCWIWISSWSSGDIWCWNTPSLSSCSSAKWQQDMRPFQSAASDCIWHFGNLVRCLLTALVVRTRRTDLRSISSDTACILTNIHYCFNKCYVMDFFFFLSLEESAMLTLRLVEYLLLFQPLLSCVYVLLHSHVDELILGLGLHHAWPLLPYPLDGLRDVNVTIETYVHTRKHPNVSRDAVQRIGFKELHTHSHLGG